MRVVVAGDVIWDFNLVRRPRAPAGLHEPVPHTVQDLRPGGAWYLAELIRLACGDLDHELRVATHGLPQATLGTAHLPYSRAFSVWSLHPSSEGSRERVWRIEEFLGCQPASAEAGPLPIEGDAPDPKLLVLEDLGLGFRDCKQAWPAALGPGGAPERIILKSSVSLPGGALWEALKREHLDRLTVVLPAGVLRAASRSYPPALSWDQALETTIVEVESGLTARELRRCRRVVLQFGEAGAASFTRCRLKFGAPPESLAARSDDLVRDTVTFERLLYHAEDLEGSWRARHPGDVAGSTSILTAAVARHELEPASYPLYLALGRGLAAVRVSHELGGGPKEFAAAGANDEIRKTYHPQDARVEPAANFFAAFPRSFLGARVAGARAPERPGAAEAAAQRSDLLSDLTGWGLEYVAARATDVMYRGPKVALAAAPKARYGAYVTVDRDEIERINAIRNLILSYQGNPDDRRPLSIAVFGPPGSGKSFAIKQLAAELFGKQKAVLEFNLAQLDRLEDLHSAFHQVRDASIRGQTPLVFWDEFDSQGLRWLQQFLAPMQDAEFRAGNATHPLGKAIFVFAGGTSSTFAKFNRPADGSAEWESFKGAKKGPDFISRLRGFVDIKGPNPIGRTDSEATGPQAGREPQPQWDDAARGDAAHLMRRAITLRAILERDHPSLIDEATGLASVSPGVVRALLRVRSYLHGARSLESVVKMSALPRASEFRAADLPSADQLGFHVTPDFLDHVRLGQLEIPIVEALAEACHEAWRELREAAGWTWGPTRDDAQRKHPLLVPYAQLSEKDKEANRVTARQSEAKLHAVGFAIERAGESARSAVSAEEYSAAAEELAKIEHDIWLRDRLLEGYEWAETSNPQLRQHPDVAPFEALGSREQDIDRAIVRSIPGTLERHGYRLVKAG